LFGSPQPTSYKNIRNSDVLFWGEIMLCGHNCLLAAYEPALLEDSFD
jgi:hypothetical protein